MVGAVGANVADIKVGDRIAWISAAYGGYTAVRTLSAELAVKLPEGISDAQAAASFMKAATACILVRKLHTIGRTPSKALSPASIMRASW